MDLIQVWRAERKLLIVYSDNPLEYVNLQTLFECLGEKVCDALLGLHIFTGSDYTAAFNKKGGNPAFAIAGKE